jgi:hypothetical protein
MLPVACPRVAASCCHLVSGAQSGAGGEFQRILDLTIARRETERSGELVPSGGVWN